ncbi:MAG: tol-pal system protein YbgF [Deltaproteobacteria bacterium]|nr:tol-pal system protein YbgF [Deltaproteobacteria bacterium]
MYAQDSGTRLAEFGAQLERLEANLQGVQGAAETQTVQIKQIEENSGRNYRDLEMRLKALEGRVELFQDILNRTVAGVAPKLAEEGKKFQAALDLIREVQYDKAIPAFQQFITQYPKSPSVGEAQFWMAECRFALRDFSQAIKDFQKFAEKYPKSNKTPPAILKQGDAFLQLQMPEEAKVFYKKLVSEYPTTEEAAQAKGKLTALEQKGDMITKLPPPPPQKGPPAPDEF